jgi:hypothetical protein
MLTLFELTLTHVPTTTSHATHGHMTQALESEMTPAARKALAKNKTNAGVLESFFLGFLRIGKASYTGLHQGIERLILSQTEPPGAMLEEEDIRVPMTSREDYKRNRLAEDLRY